MQSLIIDEYEVSRTRKKTQKDRVLSDWRTRVRASAMAQPYNWKRFHDEQSSFKRSGNRHFAKYNEVGRIKIVNV